jgi:hypothetical protein
VSIARRTFLTTAAAAGAATAQPKANPPALSSAQRLHPDFQTSAEGLEYYFLGNGRLMAAIQSAPEATGETHTGMVLMPSEHFGRKYDSLLYARGGLRRTRLTVSAGASAYQATAAATVEWSYPEGVPTVRIGWKAGALEVVEEFYAAAGEAALVRAVTVRNAGAGPIRATVEAMLSPNGGRMDEYEVDRERGTLTAIGYHRLSLFSEGGAVKASDRSLTVELGALGAGATAWTRLVYTLDWERAEWERKGYEAIRRETVGYWKERSLFQTNLGDLDHLYRVAQSGVRAAVAASGKMDGGIWQYNNEWARDTVMVAMGGMMAGHYDVARAILERNLKRIAPDGGTVEASRHREAADMELDQNGQLLTAVWTYWVWSGDDGLMKQYWETIRKLAEHVLLPVYLDPDCGMVHNVREFWERSAPHGVKDGYEITYQTWNIEGFARAAEMARHMGETALAERWAAAGRKMQAGMLAHPRMKLVDDGHLIKRRLVDGRVQKDFVPTDRSRLLASMPLGNEPVSYCDPDSANAMPIYLGQVDAQSELARRTLEFVEKLWNQRWTTGGYGRYDITSEPETPGAWPFATLFVARAYAAARNHAMVWRALKWLRATTGGTGGAWYESYGPRDATAQFYTGVIPWTYGELLMLFTQQMLGVRPGAKEVRVRPWLLEGVDRMEARLRVQGHRLEVQVERTGGAARATVNGRAVALTDGAVVLSRMTGDVTVAFQLGRE